MLEDRKLAWAVQWEVARCVKNHPGHRLSFLELINAVSSYQSLDASGNPIQMPCGASNDVARRTYVVLDQLLSARTSGKLSDYDDHQITKLRTRAADIENTFREPWEELDMEEAALLSGDALGANEHEGLYANWYGGKGEPVCSSQLFHLSDFLCDIVNQVIRLLDLEPKISKNGPLKDRYTFKIEKQQIGQVVTNPSCQSN